MYIYTHIYMYVCMRGLGRHREFEVSAVDEEERDGQDADVRRHARVQQLSVFRGRVKSLWSSYAGMYPQMFDATYGSSNSLFAASGVGLTGVPRS